MNPDVAIAIGTALAALAAIGSLAATTMVALAQKKHARASALLRVAEWFCAEEMRQNRTTIYSLDRSNYRDWEDSQVKAVKDWAARLDIAATLVITNRIPVEDFMRMYGDVVMRTVYIICSFANEERRTSGDQFLKSTRDAIPILVKCRARVARHDGYPHRIRVSRESAADITPETFRDDVGLLDFVGRSRLKKSRFASSRLRR